MICWTVYVKKHNEKRSKFKGMTDEMIISFVSLILGVVLVFVKQSNDIARMREKIKQIEAAEQRVESVLRSLSESMNRLERALVKAGLIDVD